MEDLGYKGYNIKIFFLLILASAFALVVNTNEKIQEKSQILLQLVWTNAISLDKSRKRAIKVVQRSPRDQLF